MITYINCNAKSRPLGEWLGLNYAMPLLTCKCTLHVITVNHVTILLSNYYFILTLIFFIYKKKKKKKIVKSGAKW